MRLKEFLDNFNVAQPSEIVWAHRVNNLQFLQATLAAGNIHMIEADLIRNPQGRVVMAHPPETESDLSFEQFLALVQQSNKGIKLDFKDPGVVAESLRLLRQANLSVPVILNADILIGPGSDAVKFDAQTFIDQCSAFPEAMLSVGWTTKVVEGLTYTAAMIDEMVVLTQQYPSHVTFAFRIFYAKASWAQIKKLLETENRSITFWNNEPVSDQDRKWLKEQTDPAKCFYDIVNVS